MIVFPNTLRQLRKEKGLPALLALSKAIKTIPYIRLSKIERGEVIPNVTELTTIGAALDIDPVELLIDVDEKDFDIGRWAEALDWQPTDPEDDRFAVLLGAAVRIVRTSNPDLTIAEIDRRFGIAPVILSRIEHALKPLHRWNAETIRGICALFGVEDQRALPTVVHDMERAGKLGAAADAIVHPRVRTAKTRASVEQLRDALGGKGKGPRVRGPRGRRPKPIEPAPITPAEAARVDGAPAVFLSDPGKASSSAHELVSVRLVPVYGTPLHDGLIARVALDCWVEAPRSAGPDAYGLRVCRSTLGLGLPATATVIADPGRFPSAGGLAVVEEDEGLRLLAITFDRHGRMMGYSESPSREVAIDGYDPARIAMVIAAVM